MGIGSTTDRVRARTACVRARSEGPRARKVHRAEQVARLWPSMPWRFRPERNRARHDAGSRPMRWRSHSRSGGGRGPAFAARTAAHESARRNWWEDRWSMRTGSEQVRSRYAPPRSLARRPCGRRTRFLGPSRGSLLGAAWRFAPAPSGKTNSTGRGGEATTVLSTNFVRIVVRLSPNFQRMWTTCGWAALQRACNIRRSPERRRFPWEVAPWPGSWRG